MSNIGKNVKKKERKRKSLQYKSVQLYWTLIQKYLVKLNIDVQGKSRHMFTKRLLQ